MASTPAHNTPDGLRVPRSAERRERENLERRLREAREKERLKEESDSRLVREMDEKLAEHQHKVLEDGSQEMWFEGVRYVAPKKWNYWHSWKPWGRGGRVPVWAVGSERERRGVEVVGGGGGGEWVEGDEWFGVTPPMDVEDEGDEEVGDLGVMLDRATLDDSVERLLGMMVGIGENMETRMSVMDKKLTVALEMLNVKVDKLTERVAVLDDTVQSNGSAMLDFATEAYKTRAKDLFGGKGI